MSLVDLSNCTINPTSVFSPTAALNSPNTYNPDSPFSPDSAFSPESACSPCDIAISPSDVLSPDSAISPETDFSPSHDFSPSSVPSPDNEKGSCHLLSQELAQPGPSKTKECDDSQDSTTLAADASLIPLKLPPCRVCGQRASGFHYGVNTCEACKGFFRRSLQRKSDYKCNDNGNCVIKPGKRNFCPHCRYKKCLIVGMSKTAIKTGRYTHAKRTKDIQEVKLIERQLKGSTNQNSDRDKEAFQHELILALEESRRENPYYEPEFLEKLPLRQQQYLKEYEYKKEVFGLSGGVTQSEYKEFFQKTGIDIDGRRQMLSFWMPIIETAIRKYIDFAKAIPGFKELPVEDQIALIKAARFEVWLLSNFKGYHEEHDIFTGVSGTTYHIDELAKVHEMEFLGCCFRLARRLKKFNLTEVEVSLMQAIVIFFTDRCDLKEPYAVESLLYRLVEILQAKTAEFHPHSKELFPKLMNFLTDLRVATNMNEDQSQKLKLFVCDMDITVPPLIIEMCT